MSVSATRKATLIVSPAPPPMLGRYCPTASKCWKTLTSSLTVSPTAKAARRNGVSRTRCPRIRAPSAPSGATSPTTANFSGALASATAAAAAPAPIASGGSARYDALIRAAGTASRESDAGSG